MGKDSINREYKDRLFVFIFGREENKAWTLELYNALNGSNYKNPDDIEITTLSDVLYMSMKNDVSILLHHKMSLYEQQSTYNPNMPVRELMYMGKLYDSYITKNCLNIYGSKLMQLPVPKLAVFYNGNKEYDDHILMLSDAFSKSVDITESDIEVRVHFYNINRNHNTQLKNACKPLFEYSWLIDEIRDNRLSLGLEEAIDLAIEKMPNDFLIRDFLIRNKAEVKDMCLTEYDEEKVMEMFKRDYLEEGFENAIITFINMGGTIDDAKRMLKATDEQIEHALNKKAN